MNSHCRSASFTTHEPIACMDYRIQYVTAADGSIQEYYTAVSTLC